MRPAALLDPAVECQNYPTGTLSDTLVPTASNQIAGTITYSNCDVGNVFLTGVVSLTAVENLATGDLSLSMTFNPVEVAAGPLDIYTLVGYVDGVYGVDEATITMNVNQQNQAGESYWLKNYQLSERVQNAGVESRLSGRFFHHQYGYVDFVTEQDKPILVPFDPTLPAFDGQLNFTGVSPSAATLVLGPGQSDFCINGVGIDGNPFGPIGTCAP